MRAKFRKLVKGERGSVIVEFALFLPVLLVMLFGIVELGSAWYYKQVMVNASRDGARFASLYNDNPPSVGEIKTHVQNVLTEAGFPGSASVQVTGAGGASGTQVSVGITSDYNLPVLGAMVPGVDGTISLESVTVMRHE